ncbi:carboxylesterase/lipase family protein [Variovorax sp. YR216]|uniref:carboxylesterase/lipase family protein n=1 Tax=Variovorax sp. YR216 TaxID=1882828 RepID=UPI000899348E|nr:carboxylesterase family protein [Variovorax sp. YR216]SEB15639.1 para-nitrobenzyl esterase [Variovorax sp. YR216]
MRTLLLTAATVLALAGPLHAQVVDRPVPGDPLQIDSGKVAGKVLASGVKAYFGVPFAAPPVRELRWRDPQPVKPWKGVYNADRKAPECIQVLRRKNINHYFGEEATNEDCLYLNVWEPAHAKPGAKLPVVVFIYGGGYSLGSSGSALYDGENVAKRGAVFVNFNYRLGILGNMAHPELTAESSHGSSGNYGFLDQVAALQWVQRNIARFGGDPHNVTISGQSAGASSVSAHTASPLSKGLFHRAFAMSGTFMDPGRPLIGRMEAEKIGLEVQKASGATTLAEMRNLPADKVLELQKDCQLGCAGTITVPVIVDGYFLPDSVPNIYAAGKQNDVPILDGFTRDESSNALRTAATLDEYKTTAKKLFGEKSERFLQIYPASTDAEAKAMGKIAAREGLIELGANSWAVAQSRTGKSPFYMYMFSRVHPFAPGVTFYDNPAAIGAYHTSDLPYFFDTLDAFNLFRTTREWTPLDRELSARMMDSLLAFARTGNPATRATPWPRWTSEQPQLVEFGEDTRVISESRERMAFHTPETLTSSTPRLSRD